MNYVLPCTLALALVSSQPQKSISVPIVALGELDGPRLRQMGDRTCGPYFTFQPTDSNGRGIVYFAYKRAETTNDADPTNDNEVVGVIVGSIRLRVCPKCDGPTAERTIDGSSEWVDLSISLEDLKLSPCLKGGKKSQH